MVTTQHVSPPLISQSPPATVCFFNTYPLSPEQQSNIVFMLESGKSVCYIASKLGVGKSTVGEVQSEIKSSPKKTLVDALLSSPPRTDIIWFNLSALGRLTLLPNSNA